MWLLRPPSESAGRPLEEPGHHGDQGQADRQSEQREEHEALGHAQGGPDHIEDLQDQPGSDEIGGQAVEDLAPA